MKKIILLLFVAVSALSSCSKNENITPVGDTKEAYIDATSKTTWNYYSLSENKIVGTGEENEADNAKWAARTDWDIAVKRYKIRTNGGAATMVNAKGGVYTFSDQTSFSSITELPDITITEDTAVTETGMSGETTTVQSAAKVIVFKTNEDGSLVMPPVYLQAPVYIFRTANGKDYYKVQFTQYQDENSVAGHVKFYAAQLY